MTRRILSVVTTLALAGTIGCSSRNEPETVVEKYPVVGRQQAPEAVYSRVTWSQLPQPIPPKVAKREERLDQEKVPLFRPVIKVSLDRSTLGEAVQAIAQTMGYEYSYPKNLARKRVKVDKVGTVEDSLREIERQAGVRTEIDHDKRIVRVIDPKTDPQLP